VDEEALDQRHAGRLLIADCRLHRRRKLPAAICFLARNQLLPMVFETWKGMFTP
jgi:hypothetical protein